MRARAHTLPILESSKDKMMKVRLELKRELAFTNEKLCLQP